MPAEAAVTKETARRYFIYPDFPSRIGALPKENIGRCSYLVCFSFEIAASAMNFRKKPWSDDLSTHRFFHPPAPRCQRQKPTRRQSRGRRNRAHPSHSGVIHGGFVRETDARSAAPENSKGKRRPGTPPHPPRPPYGETTVNVALLFDTARDVSRADTRKQYFFPEVNPPIPESWVASSPPVDA